VRAQIVAAAQYSMPGQHFSRAAGVAVPLFSLRGASDDGSGTILDLAPFVDWLDSWHQRVVQLLPINEGSPAEASPYNAISAFAVDPTYISLAHVIDIAHSEAARNWRESAPVRRRLQALRRARRRHRPLAYALKLQLLELGFQRFQSDAGSAEREARFEAFCQAQPWWLEDYALFRALKERFNWASWETWPEELRRRDPNALRQAAAREPQRVRFAQYLQWLAAEQWDAMRAHARQHGVLIKGDVPFVCSRDSADVWAHQQLFDLSSSAGAPPDAFSSSGQAWGLPLYNWAEMRRTGYAWWRQRARQACGLYDLFRIDHLVGLYRTYGIPIREGGASGFVPSREDEQLAQGRELLRAILQEAHGEAAVVAEDLGVVPTWVRNSLAELGIPGYKIFCWETSEGSYVDPRRYPTLSLATTGTHDTDTLVAWWEGLGETERLAVVRCLELKDMSPAGSFTLASELHLALLRRLYEAGSVLTILPIQDLFGWPERINTPGTIHRRNWSYRIPTTVEELDRLAPIRERMEILRQIIDVTGRNTAPTDQSK
jgi:4-alpha-glucanotransferase